MLFAHFKPFRLNLTVYIILKQNSFSTDHFFFCFCFLSLSLISLNLAQSNQSFNLFVSNVTLNLPTQIKCAFSIRCYFVKTDYILFKCSNFLHVHLLEIPFGALCQIHLSSVDSCSFLVSCVVLCSALSRCHSILIKRTQIELNQKVFVKLFHLILLLRQILRTDFQQQFDAVLSL